MPRNRFTEIYRCFKFSNEDLVLVEQLSSAGYELLMVCRKDRHASLFSKFLVLDLKPNGRVVGHGVCAGKKFVASVMSSSRSICAVSSVFGGQRHHHADSGQKLARQATNTHKNPTASKSDVVQVY